jgi:bacillopeptidase F (M6 metalloprotease family)
MQLGFVLRGGIIVDKRKVFICTSLLFILASCSVNDDKINEKKNDVQQQHKEVVNMIANDEKIIEMLKKKGEIPKNATPEEINQALQNYLKNKAPEPGSLQDEKAKKNYINHLKEQIQKNGKATP